MTPDRWERVKEIVYGALELEPGARAPFLARECGEDDDLRHEIDSLLETHGHGEAFLATLDGPAEARPAPDGRGAPRSARVCPECGARYDDPPAFCPADGAPLVEDPRDRVGTTLDGLYAIEALVGEGGMGAVYRARHVILGDPVAIKVVRADFAASPDLLKRFRREGQAARRFKHPNAVTVHDLRTASDGTTYMVLEYVDGRTLRAELDARGALPLDEAVELVGQLASVLDAAHAAGVVHRDVKPENVMLAREDGRAVAKLLDLGIAKVGSPRDGVGATAITTPGQIMGTPAYMSPEQWGALQRDGVDEIDGRSDVYSLGVVVYEAVSGRRPFTGTTFRDFQRGHVTGAPERLDRVVVVPPAFAAAVASALAKDRADRPATAGALAASLHAIVEAGTLPTEALPAHAAAHATAPRRRRPALPLGLAVAATLVLVLVWATAELARREPAPAPAAAAAVPDLDGSRPDSAPVLAYAVEVERTPRGETARVAEASVRTRQAFKFRFTPAEPGYLYIVYPGEDGVPTTLLTSKPAAATGVATNRAEAGAEVEFPRTADFWLAVRDDAPVTRFTVIFSPEPLAEPAFLAERAGRPLTAPEQTALERFREGRAAEAHPDGDRVVVARPAGAAPRAPLVFDIPVALATTP